MGIVYLPPLQVLWQIVKYGYAPFVFACLLGTKDTHLHTRIRTKHKLKE